MTRRPVIHALVSLSLFLSAAASRADVIFSLELDFTDEAAVRSTVGLYGGSITGGVFGAEGWTTTTRDDIILLPLPEGLEAAEGTLSVSFKNPEVDMTADYFEQWIVLSLDTTGYPFRSTPTGLAGLQSLYRGYNPDLPDRSYRIVAYMNLYDAGCDDWRNCTGETGTTPNWAVADGTVYEIRHAWLGAVDHVRFTGRSTLTRTIDISATSPDGVIAGDRFHLMVNACGGSRDNGCGAWGGPAAMKGGPIGVTYVSVVLELMGEAPEEALEPAADNAEGIEPVEETVESMEPVSDVVPDGPAEAADAADADGIPDAALDPGHDATEDPGAGMDGGCGCAVTR